MDIKYIQSFPYEILEHICSYLGTIDIITLSELIPEFESVSHKKQLIESKVGLFCEYRMKKAHFTNFLTVKPRSTFITSLNVTSIYWIAAADIRKCISSLKNLECLYVVDTKMGLLKPDLIAYNRISKLKKLGLSVTKKTFYKEYLRYFPKVTHFYLHLDSDASWILKRLMFVLEEIDCIEELWLIESGTIISIANSLYCITIPSSVIKFKAFSHGVFPTDGNYFRGMGPVYINTFRGTEISCERGEYVEIPFNNDWIKFFNITLGRNPFTSQKMMEVFDKKSFDNIKFDEINFAHDPVVSRHTCYKQVIDKLLLNYCMKDLRSLALNFCAFIAENNERNDLDGNYSNKRQKLDVCPLAVIAQNSPNIEELEIWPCVGVPQSIEVSNSIYGVIENFKKLRKLTLDDFPLHVNGSFLINVFSTCTNLSSLRITSKQQNSPLHNFLCISLKYAVSLKHLRYEHLCNISIDRLLVALAENRNLNIERLFVKCKSVEIFSSKPIHTFLDVSANLKLLYLVITDLPKIVIHRTMECLRKYNDDPRKIILLTHEETAYSGRIQIPFIHVFEMVMCLTHVGRSDVFNGYV